ncbi:beta-N-acetylhexosaminidase [Roseivirga echinicomitans]
MKTALSFICILAIFAASCQSKSYDDLALSQVEIVPQPQSIETTENETMVISSGLTIVAVNEEELKIANYLKDHLSKINWTAKIKENAPNSNFIAIQQKSIGSDNLEAYVLNTSKKGVQIEAANGMGLFYAVQTLIQMLPLKAEAVKLPVMKIKDEPRFGYRGMLLDVGRHFFPVEFVKKYLDLMALYKMNNFHWHLTEDQGWRIEIKQYPKLTEIGSKRKETMLGKNFDPYVGDSIPHSGFYTQEDVKEIVAYAMERKINVIPEIEMPGHSLAALAAYPELGCTPGPFEVGTIWGVNKNIYCPSEATFTFLENVLSEVVELFPGQYIHIGGDEAPKDRWKESAVAQAVIKREGLKDEFELQSYFIKRIEKFLTSKGKKLIGWDEILEGGLAPEATVMSWRSEKGGIEAAEQGHDIIMTPNDIAYFDHYQADPKNEPLAIGGFTSLQDVYDYEPIPAALSQEKHKHVLGAQANVWTEYMKSSDHVEYMVFPRMLALSETVWTNPEVKDWTLFQQKLNWQMKLLDARKVNYRKPN